MKLLADLQARSLVLFCVLQMWTGSTNSCLAPGGDYEFSLDLPKKLVVPKRGVAMIPCAFTAPMRTHSGRQVWFRGSPEFPLRPPEVERKDGLFRPMISIYSECSVILRNMQNLSGEYGFMLEWGAKERHVFPDRVKVAPCFGLKNELRWTIKGLVFALFTVLAFCLMCIWIRAASQRVRQMPYSSLQEKADTIIYITTT